MAHPNFVRGGLLVAAAAAGLTLASCTGGYGTTGLSVGIGGGGGYYDGYYGYDGAWGDPYWGWYGDYYYPGTGIYVYDRNRNRHSWNSAQRSYWESRRGAWRGDRGKMRDNWRQFRRDGRRGRR